MYKTSYLISFYRNSEAICPYMATGKQTRSHLLASEVNLPNSIMLNTLWVNSKYFTDRKLDGLFVSTIRASVIFKIKRRRGAVVLKSALLLPQVKCMGEQVFITITKNLLFQFLFQSVKLWQLLNTKKIMSVNHNNKI